MSTQASVIGEGTYGCIHKPSLRCKGNKKLNYTNKVSKILKKEDANAELKEYKIISKIDKETQYYLGVPTKCNIKNTQKNKNDLDKCENNKLKSAFVHDINSLSLLVMKDGGINLKEFAKKNRYNGKNHDLELFWIEMQRLFHGFAILQKHNIVHYDMKPQNALYDEKTHRVNLIDFGHMRNVRKILNDSKKSRNVLSVFHWSYPFESFFYNKANYSHFSHYNEDEKENFYQHINEKVNELQLSVGGEGTHRKERTIKKEIVNYKDAAEEIVSFFEYIVNHSNKDSVIQTIETYMKDFYNLLFEVIVPDKYDEFMKTSIKTIDSYGLGFSLIYIINQLETNMENREFITKIKSLGYKMTTPDIRKRMGIEDALHEYEGILESSGILQKHRMHKMKYKESECSPGKLFNTTKKRCIKIK
jgi:serine/threonine protein kinase